MKRLFAKDVIPLPPLRFADRLQDGETLLWEGKPDVGQFVRPKVVAIFLFSLPLIPLLVLLEDWKTSGTMPLTSPISWTIAGGAWLFGCWYNTQQVKSQALTAAYALSNRRLFIRRLERLTSKDYRPKIDEIPLQTVRPRLRPLGRGSGTITLGAPIWKYEAALRAIPDAASVYAQLTEAQALLSASGTVQQETGPYYARTQSPATMEAAAWKLPDILRRGEIVTWEGGMDPAQLGRVERVGLIALIVLAAGAGGIVLFLNGWWNPLWQGLLLAAFVGIGVPLAQVSFVKTAKNRRYALTNRRVLLIKSPSARQPVVEERELPETGGMRLVRGRNGFGTIVFEKKTRFVSHGQGGTVETYEFSFKHIQGAEAVYALVQAGQRDSFAASAPSASA